MISTVMALQKAHEALHWLGRIRTYVDINTQARGVQLMYLIELWAIAECCAELHAADDPITVDDVIELAGWDGQDARPAVERALGELDGLGFIKGCALCL